MIDIALHKGSKMTICSSDVFLGSDVRPSPPVSGMRSQMADHSTDLCTSTHNDNPQPSRPRISLEITSNHQVNSARRSPSAGRSRWTRTGWPPAGAAGGAAAAPATAPASQPARAPSRSAPCSSTPPRSSGPVANQYSFSGATDSYLAILKSNLQRVFSFRSTLRLDSQTPSNCSKTHGCCQCSVCRNTDFATSKQPVMT